MHTLTRGGLFRLSQSFVDVALGDQVRFAELHNSLGHLPLPPDNSGLTIR